MQDHSHAFLQTLLDTPSASGYEQAIQEVVRSWAKHYADEVRTDRHGNVIAVRYPEGTTASSDLPRVMLAGHCDQIALMVQHIDEHGDSVTLELGYRPLRNNMAASPAMDDKVGVWVVMETLRLLHGKPIQVP